jgi:hypothetical protein
MLDIAIAGRPLRSSSQDGCLTAASVAFALDTASGVDRSHWTAPSGGTKAAQAGSPAHMAELIALVLLETTAGQRAGSKVAGSRAAAGSVR